MMKRIAVVLGASLLSLTPMIAHAQVDETDTETETDDDTYPPENERTLDVNGFSSECILDAPWVRYDVKTIGFTADPAVATLTISDVNDKLIKVLPNQPLSGQFLYPGAEVDDKGNATDWPGWDFNKATGEWIELKPNEGDAIWRKGLKIMVEVNPTGFTQVGYPDATPVCSGPKVVTTAPPAGESVAAAPPADPGTLPRTGSDGTNTLLQGGALLVLAGGIILIASHRRRNQAAA